VPTPNEAATTRNPTNTGPRPRKPPPDAHQLRNPGANVEKHPAAFTCAYLVLALTNLALKGDSYRLRDKDLGSPPPHD